MLDVGKIVANSTNVDYDYKKNYKNERDPDQLYDMYNLHFSGLQMSMIEELSDFNEWEKAKYKIDIIQRVKFKINANRCIEQKHPIFPGLEVSVHIFDINLMFSDYILENLVKIQMKALEPFNPKSYKANFKEEAKIQATNYLSESSGRSRLKDEEDEEYESEGEDSYREISYSDKYHTPKDSEPDMASNDELNEGGDDSSDEENIETGSQMNHRNNLNQTHSENLEYSDVQMMSNYDTEQQEDTNTEESEEDEEEASEDEDEAIEQTEPIEESKGYDEESEQDESKRSDEESSPDDMSQRTDDAATERILRDTRNHQQNLDIRFALVFDKLGLTISEIANEEGFYRGDYEGIIDPNTDQIAHMEILEISLEGLNVFYDSKTNFENNKVKDIVQNVKAEITRIKIEDLQKEQNKDSKGNWKRNGPKIRKVIPDCYSMILSNPDREGTWKDDIVKAFSRSRHQNIKQFEVNMQIINNNITEDVNQVMEGEFIFRTLRLVVTIPIIERLLVFMEKIKRVELNFEQSKNQDALEVQSSMTPVPEDEFFEEDKDMMDVDEKESPSTQASTKGYIETIREQREKYLMRGKDLEIEKKTVKALLKFTGKVDALKIWIPLDSKDEYSRTMCFSL